MKPVLEAGEKQGLRQSLPQVYALNGAVYVAKIDWLLREGTFLTDQTVAYIMPRERSLDIDTELDVCLFELLSSPDKSSCL